MRMKCLIIAAVTFALFLDFSALSAGETVLYVSKDGSDAWSGEIHLPNQAGTDGPLASLEGARQRIRELRTNGKLPGPVRVKVRGGTYYLSRTFSLDAGDSGTRECSVIYEAFGDEQVVICGGRRISGTWAKHEGSIRKIYLPEAENGSWNFRQLFADGVRQTRSRIPNEGYFHVSELIPGEMERTWFKYREGDMKRWRNLSDVELVLYHSWDESRINVSDIIEEERIVKLRHASHYGFNQWASQHEGLNSRYFIENVMEGLDAPGEWYLDRHSGYLYFLPPEGRTPENMEIIAPVVRQLVLLQGDAERKTPVSYVSFSGFTFTMSDCPDDWEGRWGDLLSPSAIELNYAENCAIKNCTITNVGTYGIEMDGGSRYNLIKKNEVSYTGSGGIRIEKDPTSRNVVSDNHVHDCGLIYPSGVGICVDISSQNTIAHNHVHDVNYCGLTCRGPGNIVEYNHVHHVMKNMNDGGGIYMYSEFSDGTVVRNNVFHDIIPYNYFGWGIYLDERSEYVTVSDNIVYRTKSGNTMMHGGRYNIWINNIFVDAVDYQIFWNPLRKTAYKSLYVNNIFYYTNPESYLIHIAGTWYDEMIEKSDYNLFYCAGGGPMKINNLPETPTFEEWRKKGLDFHSIIADPLFVDRGNDDYRLKENSPMFKLGFRQIDASNVGPRE